MDDLEQPSRLAPERAETVRPDPINPKIRAIEVIDTDFHFTPSWEQTRAYLKEPFKSRLFSYPATGGEYNPEPANRRPGGGQDALGSARNANDVLRVLDRNGVDTVILNPGYNRPNAIYNEPVISAVSGAYNQLLAEEVLPASGRIKGSILINQRDPKAGAAEIRRHGDNPDFVAVYAEFGPVYEPLGSAKHDPIFDALDEFDLPLIIHGSGFWPTSSQLAAGTRTWTELLGGCWPATCQTYVSSMIMQALFDKYPDQMILVNEGGLWWVSELGARLDEFYRDHPGDIALVERKLELEETYLNRMPSEYLFDNFRFSTQPMIIPKNRKHFGWMMEMCRGEDMFLYSSDWPHQTFDPANWVVENDDVLPEETQKKILSGNARKLFKRLR